VFWVKYRAFGLGLLLCFYYDISYSNWFGESGNKDRIKFSSFIIYSINTNDDDHSQ